MSSSHNLEEVNSFLLTTLDLPHDSHSNFEPSEEREECIALAKFETPPAPYVRRKRQYYSLAKNDALSKHVMTDWEKKAIMSRLMKAKKVDIGIFEDRLNHVHERNKDEYIHSIVLKNDEEYVSQDKRDRRLFLEKEARREEVFHRHRNLGSIRKMERFIARAQAWYHIIVSHVFLTALIQERKVQEAMDTFAHLMVPMIKRFVALKRQRQAADELTREHMGDIPFPSPEVIQSMSGIFFSGWPPNLLESLAAKGKPRYLKKGSYLMHEGDLGRVMFMITSGVVSIVLRAKGKCKARTKANSHGVFELKAPCYVGEFALVCKEPRSASIICETDIGFWAVLPEDYEEVARQLSPEIANKQREATDERRRANLKRFFPLKVETLQKYTYFQKFTVPSLAKIIEQVEPIVLHDGDHLFRAGEMDSSVYFFQDGIAILTDEAGVSKQITTGTCIGMFECSCGVNERKRESIVSINYCDIWRMRRDALVDIGLSEPSALLHCRKAAKSDRALAMKKEPKVPIYIKKDPYLSYCFLGAQFNRFYELCTPCVFLNWERMVLMGQPLDSLVVIVNGTVDITFAINGEQETFRVPVRRSGTHAQGSGDAEEKLSFRGQSFIIGAYEYAASLSQYSCTVTSYGLTEAYVVEKSKIDAALPPELKELLYENARGRDAITKAYKQRDLSILEANSQCSFANVYKVRRDATRAKARKA